MAITISVLRMFQVVAETGSIVRAAERLGRTPSAISMALKQLEEDIGSPLFQGERKGSLTPLGAFTYDRACDAILQHERSLAAVRAFARNEIGRLTLACVPSVAEHILPSVTREFRERWPLVEMDIRDTDSRTVSTTVARGHVEIGIGGAPASNEEVSFHPLFRDALGVICRGDNPLAERPAPVAWKDLADQTLLINEISASIEAVSEMAPSCDFGVTVRNVTSALALVRAGVGVTVLPRLAMPVGDQTLCFLPIKAPARMRQVGLIRRVGESLSPTARTFLKLMARRLAELQTDLGKDFQTIEFDAEALSR